MAVEGFKVLASFTGTSTANTDILPTDLTVVGPAGVGVEFQVQLFQSTSTVTSIVRNTTLLPINNAVAIEGVINFTMILFPGDTINFQTVLGSLITIMVLGGGSS